MTIDDDKSIYVGGLPYNCTETQLRRVFDLHGSIIAVKIINDRGLGGKCYGFVTFKNPRSAIEAINEMDGRTIGGRVVRVNGVKARGAGLRSSFAHDSLRRNQRDNVLDLDKGKGRERENDFNKDSKHVNSLEHDGERERRHDNSHDHDQSGDYFQGRDRGRSRDLIDWERDRGRVHRRNHDQKLDIDKDLNSTQDKELDQVVIGHDKRVDKSNAQHTKRKNSSSSHERYSRDLSPESSDYQYQVEEQLDVLIKRREELQKEISDLEQSLEEKKQLIADLEKRSQKVEDLLISAKKQSSERQKRLTKLHKGFQEVKECGEKLKSSEEKLKKLVDSSSMEIDACVDLGTKDAYLTNCKL